MADSSAGSSAPKPEEKPTTAEPECCDCKGSLPEEWNAEEFRLKKRKPESEKRWINRCHEEKKEWKIKAFEDKETKKAKCPCECHKECAASNQPQAYATVLAMASGPDLEEAARRALMGASGGIAEKAAVVEKKCCACKGSFPEVFDAEDFRGKKRKLESEKRWIHRRQDEGKLWKINAFHNRQVKTARCPCDCHGDVPGAAHQPLDSMAAAFQQGCMQQEAVARVGGAGPEVDVQQAAQRMLLMAGAPDDKTNPQDKGCCTCKGSAAEEFDAEDFRNKNRLATSEKKWTMRCQAENKTWKIDAFNDKSIKTAKCPCGCHNKPQHVHEAGSSASGGLQQEGGLSGLGEGDVKQAAKSIMQIAGRDAEEKGCCTCKGGMPEEWDVEEFRNKKRKVASEKRWMNRCQSEGKAWKINAFNEKTTKKAKCPCDCHRQGGVCVVHGHEMLPPVPQPIVVQGHEMLPPVPQPIVVQGHEMLPPVPQPIVVQGHEMLPQVPQPIVQLPTAQIIVPTLCSEAGVPQQLNPSLPVAKVYQEVSVSSEAKQPEVGEVKT
jgi:hypothetical protein